MEQNTTPADRIWTPAAALLLNQETADQQGHLWVTDRQAIAAAIETLDWMPATDGMQLPLSPGTVLQDVIAEHTLTNVRSIALGALPAHDRYEGPGTYALYGIDADRADEPTRLYIVDRGTDWIVIALDLTPTITGPWPTETQSTRRGHTFYPDVPVHPLYATEDVDATDKIIRAHYFMGGCDWWITEADPAEGLAFGYACLGDPTCAEWGYIHLPELEALTAAGGLAIVERDIHWTPARVADLTLPGLTKTTSTT